MTQKKIDEFGTELSDLRTDSKLNVARVVDVETAERKYGGDYPQHDLVDEGVVITYETASGRTFNKWHRKPDEWVEVFDLVLLLDYWDLHPGDIDRLSSDDYTFEVPLSEGTDIDWQSIERTVHTEQLEAGDDDER